MGMTLTIMGTALTVTVAVAALFRWHQRRPSRAFNEDEDVSALRQYTSSWVGVIYAMTLGLGIVGSWGSWGSAQTSVTDETSALRGAAVAADTFTPRSKEQISHRLSEYATEVVQNEWPLMSHKGESSIEAGRRLSELREAYANVKPQGAYQENAYQIGLDRLEDAASARQTRADALRSKLDPLVWVGLLAGAGVILAYTFSYPAIRGWRQTFMVAAMAGMIIFMVTVIYFMHSPFKDGMRVSNGPFVELIENGQRHKG